MQAHANQIFTYTSPYPPNNDCWKTLPSTLILKHPPKRKQRPRVFAMMHSSHTNLADLVYHTLSLMASWNSGRGFSFVSSWQPNAHILNTLLVCGEHLHCDRKHLKHLGGLTCATLETTEPLATRDFVTFSFIPYLKIDQWSIFK